MDTQAFPKLLVRLLLTVFELIRNQNPNLFELINFTIIVYYPQMMAAPMGAVMPQYVQPQAFP